MKNETIQRLLTKEEVIMVIELGKEISELDKRISDNRCEEQRLAQISNKVSAEKGVESESAKVAYDKFVEACNHGRFLDGRKEGLKSAFRIIREKTTFEGFKKSRLFWDDQIECDKVNCNIF